MRFAFDVFDFVARDYRRGRIRSMRRIWNENFFPWIPLALQVSANEKQPGQFALRSRCGLQCDGVHAGDFQQALLEQLQNLQAALRKFVGLIGMFGRDAIEPRHEFVHTRVVLHGAGAQRVHAEIDRVIPGGKTREVPHDFDFADFGKAFDAAGASVLSQRCGCVRRRNIQRRQFKCALSR